MGIHLAGLVGSCAALPAVLALLLRRQAPLPVLFVLWHIALTGFAVSPAATNACAASSTGLLGKVGSARAPRASAASVQLREACGAAQGRDGVIAWWAWPLFWPYHVALRLKLHYQRHDSTEPLYSKIADGWCAAGPQGPTRPAGGPLASTGRLGTGRYRRQATLSTGTRIWRQRGRDGRRSRACRAGILPGVRGLELQSPCGWHGRAGTRAGLRAGAGDPTPVRACRYLGGWPARGDLLPPGHPAVVDVTCELPRRHKQPYHNVAVWDTHGAPPPLCPDARGPSRPRHPHTARCSLACALWHPAVCVGAAARALACAQPRAPACMPRDRACRARGSSRRRAQAPPCCVRGRADARADRGGRAVGGPAPRERRARVYTLRARARALLGGAVRGAHPRRARARPPLRDGAGKAGAAARAAQRAAAHRAGRLVPGRGRPDPCAVAFIILFGLLVTLCGDFFLLLQVMLRGDARAA